MPWPDPARALNPDAIPRRAGLGEKDRRILDELLDAGLFSPERVWINEVVGNLPTWLGEITSPAHRRWIIATYSKRPDLIAEDDGSLYAVEIKPYASYQSLGQSIMYGVLATIKTDPDRQVRPWILTDTADPDLKTVLEVIDGPRLTELGRFTLPRPSFPT